MKKYIGIIPVILGLIAWVAMGLGPAQAQNAVIYPVIDAPPFNPDPNVGFTISLRQNGQDVTGQWLPKPGEAVQIIVQDANGTIITPQSIALVPPSGADPIADGVLATSAYPGQCGNWDNPSGIPNEQDFYLEGANTLRPTDYGGMAVVQVSITGTPGFKAVIPGDWDYDGIADIYEGQYCASGVTCLNRNEDIDTGPQPDSHVGDSHLIINEYRGWMVSGVHKRGNPHVKEFFVHLVEQPECKDTGYLTDDAGNQISLKTFYDPDLQPPYEADFTPLFENMFSAAPGINVYRINGDEYVNYFGSYDHTRAPPAGGVQLVTGADPTTDRQINKNALLSAQEGVIKAARLIQCIDSAYFDPLGTARKGHLWGPEKDDGNAIIFPQRVWKSVTKKIAAGAGRLLTYYTFENDAWIEKPVPDHDAPPTSSNAPFLDFWSNPGVRFITHKALAWYAAHEAAGHAGCNLTQYELIAGKGKSLVSYGYHREPETGSNVDVQIVQKIGRKTTDPNSFYIATYLLSFDESEMELIPVPQ